MSDFLPQANDMAQLVRTPSAPSTILRNAILKALYTASASGLNTTASISNGSASGLDLMQAFKQLQAQGFSLSIGSSNFTVTWQRV